MKKLSKEQIQKAILLLEDNEVVILPTDTIYGLSAKLSDLNEIKINELKKAEASKPLIVLISSFDQLKDQLVFSDDDLDKLNSSEPTTVIFKYRDSNKTIALRIVKRDDIKQIIDRTGPIFSTSVNKHGNEPIHTLKGLNEFIGEEKVFYTEELISKPSRIYNTIKKEYIR